MRCEAEQHLRITSGSFQGSEHGPLVEMEKTPDLQSGSCGFESRRDHQYASLAQLVEQLTLNQEVQGSSP